MSTQIIQADNKKTLLPILQLYENDQVEAHYVYKTIQQKPFFKIIERLWRSGPATNEKNQEILQDFFTQTIGLISMQLSPQEYHSLHFDFLEKLLQTAIYVGLDKTYSTLILSEYLYFLRRHVSMRGTLPLKMSLVESINPEIEIPNPENTLHKQQMIWKDQPNYPCLHNCLQKDVSPLTGGLQASLFLGGSFFHAIQVGNLRFLKQLSIEGAFSDQNFYICSFAARFGHLHILEWARERGYPWNGSVCRLAAANGHLHILQWARASARGTECPWDVWTCAYAAKGGHLNILKWAREQGCPWDQSTCELAALNGHLDVLKWARSQGCLWGSETAANAALNGHLDLLKWATEQGCPWDDRTCIFAASKGHLPVLKWIREKGYSWNAKICDYAALNGHLDVLKWLREQGCLWSETTTAAAAEYGQLDVLKWLREQACPWDAKCGSKAAMNGHIRVLDWLKEQGLYT